jgi:hypothetical protein
MEEAKVILECLSARKEEVEALIERKKELDHELWKLRQFFLNCDPYEAARQGYIEKKKELNDLQSASYALHVRIRVYDSLLAKYETIANGTKHGLHKYSFVKFQASSIFLQ